MLRGVSLSAAQSSSEKKTTRARSNWLRIRTLLTLFDRRALNRITYCRLWSKSIVRQIVCHGKSSAAQILVGTGGDAHRHLDAIPRVVSAVSKCCTNHGDCYTNSEHPAL